MGEVEETEQTPYHGWEDDTLVDKLDVYVQALELLDDLFQAKIRLGEGLTVEELQRSSTVLNIYFRKYRKSREDWVRVVS